MYTFIISFIVVTIISLCFMKKEFWENRYLVLLISCGVALIATLAINFSIRSSLDRKAVVVYEQPIYPFYVQDTLINKSKMSYDSTNKCTNLTITRIPLVKDYSWYDEHKAEEFLKNTKDTVHKQVQIHAIYYSVKGTRYVGYFYSKYKQNRYRFDEIYVVPSPADSIVFISKKKLVYDVKPNNWVLDMSLPRIQTITILHIPPSEYAMIPDSLIRKLPF